MPQEKRGLSKRQLKAIEDQKDGWLLEAAIKQNKGRPLIPWEEAKKRLGLKFD